MNPILIGILRALAIAAGFVALWLFFIAMFTV